MDALWLGLGDTSQLQVGDPLALLAKDPATELLRVMRNPDYFSFTCKHLFNIDLFPFQAVILKELWIRPFPMFIGSRGLGKSFLLALYSVLRALLHQGCKICVVGSGFRQAKVVFEYAERIYADSPILRDILGSQTGRANRENGPHRDSDRWELIIGDSAIQALPLGDGCAAGKTQVTLGNRFATMQDEHIGSELTTIQRKESIWSQAGFINSDEAYSNGRKPTKKVKSDLGMVFEGTHNHKLKVLEAGNVVWKRLDEMRVGDTLLIDRSYRWHTGQEPAGLAESYSLGQMIGDGNWTNTYAMNYATQDAELIQWLREGMGMAFRWNGEKDPHHYVQCGKQIRSDWLRRWGLKHSYALTKVLPPVILRSPRDAVTACLQGIFDTDGHIQVGTAKGGVGITVGLTNTSEKLIDQIQYILLHYGILSFKQSRKRGENWETCHELLMTGRDATLFHERVGFRLSRKRNELQDAVDKKRRFASTTDEVPGVGQEMIRVAESYGTPWRSGGNDCFMRITPSVMKRRKCFTRGFINQFLDKYGFTGDPFVKSLESLANPDIYYSSVVSIEDGECETYDIHVPETHEYCANGFFSHNTKIRGQRANYLVAEEFASFPPEVYENVVAGFAAVSANPVANAKRVARINHLKSLGKWNEENEQEESQILRGNQAILSGTAYWGFNHFAAYWRRYKAFIESQGDRKKLGEIFGGEENIDKNFNWRDYSVIRMPYNILPPGFMDDKHVARSRATVHKSIFQLEFECIFVADSDGFFRRSLVESCVTGRPADPVKLTSGLVEFRAALYGSPSLDYVYGIDPAAMSDNFCIVILELHADHRRLVHCWTTTKASHVRKLKDGLVHEKDYYKYCARKLRELFKVFPPRHIAMDSQGGGFAVAEALQDDAHLQEGEVAILPVIDPDPKKTKPSDFMPGQHILELVQFASSEYTSHANHGLRKDFEDKALLFPAADTVLSALAFEEDQLAGRKYDTLEECYAEIEELKDELASIVMSQTATGRDHWDTPEVKLAGAKKGRMRKDRYTSLLIANWASRTFARTPPEAVYDVVGGFAHQIALNRQGSGGKPDSYGAMYQGTRWGGVKYAGGITIRRGG